MIVEMRMISFDRERLPSPAAGGDYIGQLLVSRKRRRSYNPSIGDPAIQALHYIRGRDDQHGVPTGAGDPLLAVCLLLQASSESFVSEYLELVRLLLPTKPHQLDHKGSDISPQY